MSCDPAFAQAYEDLQGAALNAELQSMISGLIAGANSPASCGPCVVTCHPYSTLTSGTIATDYDATTGCMYYSISWAEGDAGCLPCF